MKNVLILPVNYGQYCFILSDFSCSHEAWDSRYLDIHYNDYYVAQLRYVVIDDIFIHRIIDVLELGKSDFISDPIYFAWQLIEQICILKEDEISLNSNEYNSDEGMCVGKDLLLLRTLNLMFFR